MCESPSAPGEAIIMPVATTSQTRASPMNASGSRPCAASQPPDKRGGGLRSGVDRRERGSSALEDGDPTAVGLLIGIMTKTPLSRLAEKMTGLAIGDGAQPHAGGQSF